MLICRTLNCAAIRPAGSVSMFQVVAAKNAKVMDKSALKCIFYLTFGCGVILAKGGVTTKRHWLSVSTAIRSMTFLRCPAAKRFNCSKTSQKSVVFYTLGQSAPTLSGGEAQRVKLAAELARPDTGRTLYLLDEPTTGLHFDDLAKLLEVLQRLVDIGNSVVLIEHNLDIIKAADWVIDMGPEAGMGGGHIVVQGTPEMIVQYAKQARKPKSEQPPSYTGDALASVLEAGPYAERVEYNPNRDDRWRKNDMDIEDIGKSAKMPWESDGRRWHTQDRVGRQGEPVNWDGKILEEVADYIQREEGFGETNWSERTVVEITGLKKSQGWFFHAITGEAWLLKMKFRVRPRTFKRDELIEQLPLQTANEMDDLPIYGNTPRVRVLNNKSGFQEIEIRAHSWQEINIPAFWEFLDQAIASFQNRIKRVELNIDDHTPWAKLGQKWHFMQKGFPTGRKVQWDFEVLEVLHNLLQEISPDGSILWKNKQVVHLYRPDQKDPWASIQTKKPDALWLQLSCPQNTVALGRVADLADDPSVTNVNGKDLVRINFKHPDQVKQPKFKEFLQEHLEHLTQ